LADLGPDFQEYTVWPGPPEQQHPLKYLQKLDRPASIPASIYTGTLGLAGKSAFSAYDVFAKEKTKESKTLFVSAAAGPVGT
jgi:NADPH-dependent curcumin reductase CurA